MYVCMSVCMYICIYIHTYRGEFEKGKWHGKGLLTHHNGDVYEGSFKYGTHSKLNLSF